MGVKTREIFLTSHNFDSHEASTTFLCSLNDGVVVAVVVDVVAVVVVCCCNFCCRYFCCCSLLECMSCDTVDVDTALFCRTASHFMLLSLWLQLRQFSA